MPRTVWDERRSGAVKELMRPERDVQSDVIRELQWDPKVEEAAIGVAVERGAVTLSGHVRSLGQKEAAVKAAWRVYGVTAVADEVEVRLEPHETRDDADIAQAIASALEWHAAIPVGVIRPTVRDGWVTLEGEVDWHYRRNEAERVVRNLRGIRGVTNLVAVKPSRASREVHRRISEALHRQAQLDSRRIWVETSDGTAILHGTVSNWQEAVAARKAAESAPGIRTVRSELSITP